MDFLMNNLGTIIIGLIVLAVAGLIVFKLYKNHKAGKTSCGCGCANCPSNSMCHKGK